jgi:glycine cleavage system aminomethyltransferase T
MSQESQASLRTFYERALQFGKPAFTERPYYGSPAAPAQAETNASNLWGHMNAGYLIGYEYTRWWKECWALRNTAVIGDWSWLNKVRVTGPDAERLLNYASVKDISKQAVGQIMYTPMVNSSGKVAIEGLTIKLADGEYIFTQSGAQSWLAQISRLKDFNVLLDDITPDYTCYALQGPRSTEILEAVSGDTFKDLKFSRWRKTCIAGEEIIVGRQGVTGEVGYELLMRTDTDRGPDLWREVRRVGKDFGLRELGLKAQMVGHIETGIATVIRDFVPARMEGDTQIRRFAKHWMSREELDAISHDLSEHFCSPAELGWAHTINLKDHDFYGRDALEREADVGGPPRRLMGLMWNSEDMAALYGALFFDAPSAPPPDLPYGQFRLSYLPVFHGDMRVGWATGASYSPNMRRMISLGRLRKDLAVPGTELHVLWGGFSDEPSVKIRATVHALPFIKQHRRDELTQAVLA